MYFFAVSVVVCEGLDSDLFFIAKMDSLNYMSYGYILYFVCLLYGIRGISTVTKANEGSNTLEIIKFKLMFGLFAVALNTFNTSAICLIILQKP